MLGFDIQKPSKEIIGLSNEHDIRCVETCTISGLGTHVEITGAQSTVRLSNFKFMLSDASAVRVKTTSVDSTVTFCDSQFFRNTGTLGGAMWIARQSGVVNVVGSTFTNNEAVKGGAIYGGAQMLLIINSLFLNNVAFKAVSRSQSWGWYPYLKPGLTIVTLQGSAVFAFSESAVAFHSTYFSQNSVSSADDHAVVLEAGDEALGEDEIVVGDNMAMSGSCDGFFILASKTCRRFGKRKIESDLVFGGDTDVEGDVSVTLNKNSTANRANKHSST
jgi:predicted outer membrane repeat protein